MAVSPLTNAYKHTQEQQPDKIMLYGSSISYFTGKMEAYFRLKGLSYRLKPLTHPWLAKTIQKELGSSQMPAVRLPNGRWLTDTTAMIQWFETQYPKNPVIPNSPELRFFSLLLEDYADEWLWRPAMHYRWHTPQGANFAATHLAHEIATGLPAPIVLKRWLLTRRQRKGFTTGDGVTPSNVSAVEAIYHRLLGVLSTILTQHKFLLGDQPSLADIGFAGPFLRHFAQDPVPAEIMRQDAPEVYEWASRLWNTQPGGGLGLLTSTPDTWAPLLEDIASVYLPYLNANAFAVQQGKKRFKVDLGGAVYPNARASHYRVFCLAQLRKHYMSLPEASKPDIKNKMEQHGLWEPLWAIESLPEYPASTANLPFKTRGNMLDVY